ncbi:hypothetical protein Q428_11465 [Fervidicella metallireducens AeB]|uniref:Uncharacterized protein n=1 Tax=Fervidicella metallireducens AeB TaxID=1403537 RepID=A0A017RSS5_9CLOT|nr:hypothetical protein Q428_11465 [Fervidicella metallireducens AeB]
MFYLFLNLSSRKYDEDNAFKINKAEKILMETFGEILKKINFYLSKNMIKYT